jgi:hypothetical protein
MVSQPLRWFFDERDLSPFLAALSDVRHKAARERYCDQHVQAITVAIDSTRKRRREIGIIF